MNMAEYTTSWQWQSAAGAAEEDLKMIILTGTRSKIRFIFVRFNCKRKEWGKMNGH